MDKIGRVLGVSRQRVSVLLRVRREPDSEDTTERGNGARRADRMALTEPEFRMIAEALPHIVWVAAPDGSTEYFNGQGVDYTGQERAVNRGWGWTSLVHPDDAERALTAWQDAVAAETLYELEYRIRRADGEFRWHAFRALPIRNHDGYVVKWLGTATDIEERKRLEEGRNTY
jgi:PAS domain S-box-containing protein